MIIMEFGKAELQSLEKNSMFISFPKGSPTFWEDRNKMANFWNRKFNSETKEWEVPYNEKIFEEIRELFNDEIYYMNERPKRRASAEIEAILNNFDWGKFKPYPYQVEGIKYGLTKRNWILGDTMGLGKSFQTLQLANIQKSEGKLKHCLVICCVNSLKYNWKNEIEKFTKESAVILGTRYGKTDKTKNKLYDMSIEETKVQIKNCPEEFYWIINVEKIRATKEEEKLGDTIVDALNVHIEKGELGMIIIDEIHMCRNPKAQQSKMLIKLGVREEKVGKRINRVPMNVVKIGMSGTLVVNDPLNLYVPMNVVGLITTDYWTFGNRYFIKDRFGGVCGFQNVDELKNILHNSFIRRTKEEVAKDLPPVVFKDEILEMSPEETRIFNELTGKIQSELNGDEYTSTLLDTVPYNQLVDKIDLPTTIMSIITRMRQCATHTGLLSSTVQKSTKFERLKDILEEARQNGEKVLVFCQFTQAIEIAKEYFREYNPKIIVGGLGDKVMNIVKEHEESEGFSVIFAQTQTLGVGHSLPNTTQCVFLTLLWDYATFEQCFNRCHRITSKKSVTVTNLIMKDTYDEHIYDMIYAKKAMGDIVVDMKEIEACKEYLKKLNIQIIGGKLPNQTTLFDDKDIINASKNP